MGSMRTNSTDTTPTAVAAVCAGKVLSPGELLTALEGAPLDTIYLDAAGQEKGEGEKGGGESGGRDGWCTCHAIRPYTRSATGQGVQKTTLRAPPLNAVASCNSTDTTSRR